MNIVQNTIFIDCFAIFLERSLKKWLDSLEVNKDIPQFKEGADPETGEVHPIEGDFDPLVAGNILVWEKLDGTREVATGRHRLASAKRSGQKTISAMVLKEADGWSLDEVFTLDAQSNIKDGKGSINDYYQYFKNTELTEAEARREGLLQISKANKAFQLAKNSSSALQTLWRSGEISDTNAALIAGIGKGHHDAQDAAIRYKKLPVPQLRAMVESLIAFKGREVPKMRQTDLFDHDESLKQIEAVAKLAAQKRDQVKTAKRTIASLKNRKGEIDEKKAERAEKEFGVKIESVEAANQKLAELEAEAQRFVKWHSDPELRDALFEEAGFPTKKDQAEAPEPPDEPPDPTDQELTPEQQDLIAENYGLAEKMAQSFSKKFPNADPDQFRSLLCIGTRRSEIQHRQRAVPQLCRSRYSKQIAGCHPTDKARERKNSRQSGSSNRRRRNRWRNGGRGCKQG